VIVLHRGQALAASGANPADWDGFGAAPESGCGRWWHC
jgi:hypothetical protein